jgi:DNA-binding transcriptional MerR regulator/quercetin dioxygenase-like cupin family protein
MPALSKTRAREPRRLAPARPPRYLTIGQTARILGLSPSTLRLWEHAGLVRPARTDGKYRLYGAKTLERLKRIQYLRKSKHLNIAAIHHFLGDDSTEGPGAVEPRLGNKLRQLRLTRGLKLHEVASRAGISTGFLSAVERSRANPSVATIHRLAGVLGVNVHQLFDHERATKRVVRRKERRVYNPQPGVRVEFLSTSASGLKSMLFRVAPGAGSEGTYFHDGEELLYVMEGRLELWLDEVDRYVLEPGDTLSFQSSHGHRWNNPGADEAVLIWVNTTPPAD